MYGCIRYLSLVDVLPVVDDRQLSPCVEKQHEELASSRAVYCSLIVGYVLNNFSLFL